MKKFILKSCLMLFCTVLLLNFVACQPPEEGEVCNHTWTLTSSVQATCTIEGKEEYVCDKCGQTKTENLGIGDHTGEWKFDLTHHWKEYNCEHKDSLNVNKEEHDHLDGYCSKCSFFTFDKILKNMDELYVFCDDVNLKLTQNMYYIDNYGQRKLLFTNEMHCYKNIVARIKPWIYEVDGSGGTGYKYYMIYDEDYCYDGDGYESIEQLYPNFNEMSISEQLQILNETPLSWKKYSVDAFLQGAGIEKIDNINVFKMLAGIPTFEDLLRDMIGDHLNELLISYLGNNQWECRVENILMVKKIIVSTNEKGLVTKLENYADGKVMQEIFWGYGEGEVQPPDGYKDLAVEIIPQN